MQIIKPEQILEIENKTKSYLELDLNAQELNNIPIKILEYNTLGFNKIILNYDFNKIKIPYTKVCDIILSNILKIVKNEETQIYFKGFPQCVFEKRILRPGFRFYYENNIKYLNKQIENYYLKNTCKECKYYNECKVVCQEYNLLNSNLELIPIISNKDKYQKNLEKVENFENLQLKNITKNFLEDFKEDKLYLRKKILYVESFPKNFEDSSNERFIYFIYNREDDFDQTYNLIKQNYDYKIINELFQYLKKANEFALSFGLMGDKKLRKTFYFTIEDLNKNEIIEISKILNLNIDLKQNYWGVGLDFKEENLISKKVYYKKKNVRKIELLKFCEKIDLEFKTKLSKVIEFLDEPINQVLFDYKYKNEILSSIKLEFSMQYDKINLKQLAQILNIENEYFENKEFYTLSFELYSNKSEKVNFYYSLD